MVTSPAPLVSPARLCFIHVYKCGGTSLRRHILDRVVTPATRVVDQWVYDWEREVTARERELGNLVRGEHLRYHAVPPGVAGPIAVLTHSFFYDFMTSWPGFSFVTMLRDPVQRVLSQFSFQRRVFADFRDVEVRSWLDTIPGLDFNMQTAALCGTPAAEIGPQHLQRAVANLHRFDVFGFVDDYPAAFRLFNRVYGIADDGPPPHLNVSPQPIAMAPELAALVRERCALDLALLDYARRLFRAKVAAIEMIDAGDPALPPPSLFPR
jgi:hypothetical protein